MIPEYARRRLELLLNLFGEGGNLLTAECDRMHRIRVLQVPEASLTRFSRS
jgi:hypothetical protein